MTVFGEEQPTEPGTDVLASAERLSALREAGLSAASDEGMERFARPVASLLGVPVALVSLVEADRQVFPGMVGLAEPWATGRQTPLSHSLCQHVVASGSPLVLPDARLDKLTCASLAIEDLGVVAYAGMPLTDDHGRVLGSLCAIDHRPRAWSQRELTDLADLAAACSGELRLRIMSGHAWQAQADAERASAAAEAARQAAERSDGQAQASAAQASVALQRAELMLRAAEDPADTAGLAEVRRRVRDLVSGDLKPVYVGLVLSDGQELRRVPDPEVTHIPEAHSPAFPLDSPFPSAAAVRTGEMIVISNRSGLGARFGQATVREFDVAGFQSAVCVPLPGTRGTLGALALGWATPHQVDVTERAVLTAIAGYTALAVERAIHLDDRITVGRQLQRAMLTDLPAVPGLEIAASYIPAAAGELVGGDWYDAYPLPGGRRAGPAGSAGPLAITVGDITGHDMNAATVMGQVRSMLRQADLHDDLGPAEAVTAVEKACEGLSLEATGTLVHAHLRPAGAAAWQLTWTNAGHPPPLLGRLGGETEQLGGHDVLLWPGLPHMRRTDWQRLLAPGDTLLLYTDGLVDHRTHGIDPAISRAAALLSATPATQPLPDLLAQLIDTATGDTSDDIVLLAVRIPHTRHA